MCASVWTGSTIAPIAAKLATSPWPAAVATEPQTFHLHIDADARLAAAAGGVIRYVADVAGLESRTIARMQSAVIAACLEAFEHLADDSAHLEITFARFIDRLEVELSHRGDTSPAVGLDAIAGFAAQVGGAAPHSGAFDGFDRVQYETRGGKVVTRLTKYIVPPAPGV
jgi:hypothetical protein